MSFRELQMTLAGCIGAVGYFVVADVKPTWGHVFVYALCWLLCEAAVAIKGKA